MIALAQNEPGERIKNILSKKDENAIQVFE
jgi:hypothetical protein